MPVLFLCFPAYIDNKMTERSGERKNGNGTGENL